MYQILVYNSLQNEIAEIQRNFGISIINISTNMDSELESPTFSLCVKNLGWDIKQYISKFLYAF